MEKTETTAKEKEEPVTHQDKLLRLFDSIEAAVQNRCLIREQTLLELSRYVIALLRESRITYPQPESFEMMAARVEDYLSFELDVETDCSRASSYSRAYQAVKLIEIAQKDGQRNDQLQTDAAHFAQYERLLSVIAQNPGITHKDLARQIGVSPSALSQTAAKLEQSRYLLAQKIGSHKYYRLSYAGTALLELIRARSAAARERYQRQRIILELEKIVNGIFRGNVPEKYRDIEKHTKDMSLEQLIEILEEAQRERDSNVYYEYYKLRETTPSYIRGANEIIETSGKKYKGKEQPEKSLDCTGIKRRVQMTPWL